MTAQFHEGDEVEVAIGMERAWQRAKIVEWGVRPAVMGGFEDLYKVEFPSGMTAHFPPQRIRPRRLVGLSPCLPRYREAPEMERRLDEECAESQTPEPPATLHPQLKERTFEKAGVINEMTEPIDMAISALWQAWMELNTIVARDGVPYKFDGTKSGVSEEYFCKVKDDCASAFKSLTGKEIMPWPFWRKVSP